MPNSVHSPMSRAAAVWLLGFVLLQIACQLGLLIDLFSPFRAVFRSAAFATSLAALFLVPGMARRHPSRPFLFAVLGLVAVAILHPHTNSALAGVAQFALYTAIIAPLFWVTRLTITTHVLARLLVLIWGFHTLSAFFGVLQTLMPGRFQPAVSGVILGMGNLSEGLKITLADGTAVWRPMGLTDQPGGASSAGVYAILFGMGLVAIGRNLLLRLAAGVGIAIGMYCIYLSQVRAAVVMGAITSMAFLAVLFWLRRPWDALRLLIVLFIAGVVSLVAAVAVGGEGVTGRLETLVEERPDEVYYQNRGRFLEETLTEHIPNYPLGAGLGRWGMVRYYFGDETNPESPAIWSEIQWTAWVLDGGLPLLIAYLGAIVAALWAMARAAARTADRWLAGWAALVAAYDVTALATTFGFVPFIGQAGMEFWFLNGAVWAAIAYSQRPGRP